MSDVPDDPPELDEDAYFESLADLRQRVPFRASEYFDEHNSQLRFDRRLVRYERQTRNLIETIHSDETFNEQVDRTDVRAARDEQLLQLPFPVQAVDTVERRRNQEDDFQELARERYRVVDHGVELLGRRKRDTVRRGRNKIRHDHDALTWRDLGSEIRVTYDRGFDPIPADVLDVQASLVIRKLRLDRQEQNIAAASPDEFAGVAEGFDSLLTEDIERRIDELTNIDGVSLVV